MKKISTLIALMAVSTWVTLAQNGQYTYLQTGAVQNSWYTTACSIDTMIIDVRPKGLFAEVSMTMDFSTRGLNFSNYDSLEIQMMFQLPPDVEVTDMWLWVFGQPEKAGVYDRWTASQIYEEIVSRRTDPAILYHYTWYDYYTNESVTNLYRFNIFPMLNDMPRKTKITYQVPLRNLNGGNFMVPMPMDIARLSNLPIQQFKVRYHHGIEFGDPAFTDAMAPGFADMGPYMEADLTSYDGNSLSLLFPSQRPSVYLGSYINPNNNINYYQLGFVPREALDLPIEPKKCVVVFDNENFGGNAISQSTVRNTFVSTFMNYLADGDSLNVLFGGPVSNWISANWIGINPVSRVQIANQVSNTPLANNNNLTDLLLNAYQYIVEHGGEGNILLVTNSNQFASLSLSNNFVNGIAPLLQSAGIRVIVVDYDNVNNWNESFWLNDNYLYGNAYALNTLAAMTQGEYWTVQTAALSDIFSYASAALEPVLSAMDVYVTRTDGLTYSNYDVGGGTYLPYYGIPIGRTGKSAGTGDWQVNITGVDMDGEIHQSQLIIPDNMVYPLDTVTDNIWGGLHQRSLYNLTQTNSLVQTIVQHSKDHRVLSKYTAFLALEPSEGPLPITNENPGGPVISTESLEATVNNISVFPNPVGDMLNLDISLTQVCELTVQVMDINGKWVKDLYNGKMEAGNSIRTFDVSQFNAGVYVIVVQTSTGLKNHVRFVKL